MGRKRHTAEEIVSKLRQVDVLTAQGQAVADAIRTRRSWLRRPQSIPEVPLPRTPDRCRSLRRFRPDGQR
jgi:hypothetical protein